MGILIAIVVGIIILTVWGVNEAKKPIKGVLYYQSCTYLSGFGNIPTKSDCMMYLKEESLIELSFSYNNKYIDMKKIPFKDILEVRFITKDFIKEKTNVGNALAFGILGSKDTEIDFKDYVGIIYKSENKEKEEMILLDFGERGYEAIKNTNEQLEKFNSNKEMSPV